MKKEKRNIAPLIGGSSLLVIFGVVCLVVLSLLALNTVLAEQRLSRAYERNTLEWYEADLRAQEIFASLRAGETPPEVTWEADTCRYGVPVSENRSLLVQLRRTKTGWEVVCWQTVSHPDGEASLLPLWNGLD